VFTLSTSPPRIRSVVDHLSECLWIVGRTFLFLQSVQVVEWLPGAKARLNLASLEVKKIAKPKRRPTPGSSGPGSRGAGQPGPGQLPIQGPDDPDADTDFVDLEDLLAQVIDEDLLGGDGGSDPDDGVDDDGDLGADDGAAEHDVAAGVAEAEQFVKPPKLMAAIPELRSDIFNEVQALVLTQMGVVTHAIQEVQQANGTPTNIESGDLSLLVTRDGDAVFVHWTNVQESLGRRVKVDRNGVVTALVAYRIPEEPFTDVTMIIKICPGYMMRRKRKKDGATILPSWCVLMRNKYRHCNFAGPLSEYNPNEICVQCSVSNAHHVETEPAATDMYVCSSCLSCWHNACAEYFNGAKQNSLPFIGMAKKQWVCPVCSNRSSSSGSNGSV
jgi:hypothetical protein